MKKESENLLKLEKLLNKNSIIYLNEYDDICDLYNNVYNGTITIFFKNKTILNCVYDMKGNNKIKGVINEKISDKKTFTYIDDIRTLLDGKVLFINNGNKYILEPVENGAIQIKFYKGFVTEIESREF